MSSLVQIIYISRSTFAPPEKGRSIDPNVARILVKSRVNNRRNGLVGVLYFGDGCFLQCLEGEETAVDALYTLLQSDARHKNIKLLSRKSIASLSYTDWEMKYVPIAKEMGQLLAERGYPTFDPYRFDEPMIQKVMALLKTTVDPVAMRKVDKLIEESAKPSFAERASNKWVIAVGAFALGVVVAVAFLKLT